MTDEPEVTDGLDLTAALAATIAPARAVSLLERRAAGPGGAVALLAAAREERLSALARALRAARPAAERPEDRAADPQASCRAGDSAAGGAAWPVLPGGNVLPFDLPSVSPALLSIDTGLAELGERAARCAASGIASVLGGDASIRGRLLPAIPDPAAAALVAIDLTALPGPATVAVDRGFASRLARRVAGGSDEARPSDALSPAERAVLELAVLAALDALAAETGIERALAPRLAARGARPDRPVCIELTVTAAGVTGRALLALPEAALRALPRASRPPPAVEELSVPASLRAGAASLDPAELADLQAGDVLLLEGASAPALVLPDGSRLTGQDDGDALLVDSITGPAAEGPGASLVPVEVELGVVALPVTELLRLTPGAVVPLGIARSGTVTLRVGGRAVAEGELVDVDGAVGVRIAARAGARCRPATEEAP